MQEQPHSFEQKKPIDFLSEDLKVTFTISSKAVDYLPEITPEDLETRRERYRIFLGTVDESNPESPVVNIEAILEKEEGDPWGITEGKEQVHAALGEIRQWVEQIRRIPEYTHLEMVGDIHTHPVRPQEFAGVSAPSDEDVEDLAKHYEAGILDPQKPFIFAIAAPDESGQTRYGFYRIVKSGNTYSYKALA